MKSALAKTLLSLFASAVLLAGCQTSTIESQFTRLSPQDETGEQKDEFKPPEVAIVAHLTGTNASSGWEYAYMVKSGLSSAASLPINTTIYDASDLASFQDIRSKKTNIIIAAAGSQIGKILSSRVLKRDMLMLSLSNDESLAKDNVLALGHKPRAQFDVLTHWLIVNDYKNIFSLLPAGRHSNEMVKTLQERYIANNATLMRSSFYLDDEKSVDDAIKVIMGNIEVMYEKGKKPARPPVIYVNDSTQKLQKILSKFTQYNMPDKFIIAGDSRLDTSEAKNLNVIFTGSSLHSNREIFNKIMEKAYEDIDLAHLNYMHLICYDMGRIAAMGFSKKAFSAKNFVSSLNDKIYTGLSGDIVFNPVPVERKYSIIFYDESGVYKNIQN